MISKLSQYRILLTVNDKRGPGEEDTGNFIGVRCEFLSGHDTVEDDTCVWKTARLDSQWCD